MTKKKYLIYYDRDNMITVVIGRKVVEMYSSFRKSVLVDTSKDKCFISTTNI